MTVKNGMQRFSISMTEKTTKSLDNIVKAANEGDVYPTVTRSQVVAQLVSDDPRINGFNSDKNNLDLLNTPLKGLPIVTDLETQDALRNIARKCSLETVQRLAAVLFAARKDHQLG